jgi:hypothetical protein
VRLRLQTGGWLQVSGIVAETLKIFGAQLSPAERTATAANMHRKAHEEGQLKTAALAPVFAELMPSNADLDVRMVEQNEGMH